MNRIPFDTQALRQWADFHLTAWPQRDVFLIRQETWEQLRADLLAAADEIELLMAERVKEKAA